MQLAAITPEELLRSFLGSVTFGIDIAVGVVIAISIIRGFIMYVKLLRKSPLEQTKEEEGIKRYVGNGLDLEVGGTIIKTILAPSNAELISLAVIIAIRITLNWSLSRELRTV